MGESTVASSSATLLEHLRSSISRTITPTCSSCRVFESVLLETRTALPEIETYVTYPYFLKHSIVASTVCLFLYDYVCTLDREVKFVWSRPRSLGTYLFFLNRYLPFFDLSIALYTVLAQNTAEACHRQYGAIIWLNTVGITVSQTILSLRTIAIWERKPWVVLTLLAVYLGTLIPSIVIIHIFLRSLDFAESINGRCALPSAKKIIILAYALIMLSETTIVTLTLIRAIKHLRQSDSTWVHQLYKRGILFYAFLLCVTVLNLVYPAFVQPAIRSLFTDLQRALHSMLCNRVVFIIFSRQRQDEIDYEETFTAERSARSGQASDGIIITSMLDTYVTQEDRTFQQEDPS